MRTILGTAIVMLCALSTGAAGGQPQACTAPVPVFTNGSTTTVVAGCSAFKNGVPDLLWLPPSAVIDPNWPRQAHLDGETITADVSFDFPDVNRTALVAALRGHFKTAGWRERGERTVTACCGDPTSFKQGWRHVCPCSVLTLDEVPNPPRDVADWDGEWQDAHGNRIGYSLIAGDSSVRGYAAYSPKVMALANERQQKAAQAEERRREATKATAR